MAGEATVTLVGNVGSAPELRKTPAGKSVASFSVAVTPRVKGESGEYADGDPTWYRCTVWGDYAENVAKSLDAGARVVVVGLLSNRAYDTKEGEKRTSLEVLVTDTGPCLRFAVAVTSKVTRAAHVRAVS